jgi:ABC-type Fe3+/spermidine/putrescine transport system ATPase subunit
LVGPSGCGKTTTLNIIAGLSQPDEGTVLIDNALVDGRIGERIVHVTPSERKVGYVFQDYALFPHMTVRENVSYGLKARHLQREHVKKRTHSLLELVGLLDHSEHYPAQLSGGQKQRIALARALATEPDILLLDEPLAALDPRTRESLRVELRKMLGTLDVTSIYVTHELAEAYAVSDKIAVMGSGRIEQTGHRDEIFTKPNSAYVAQFLGQNVYRGKAVNHTFETLTIEVNGIAISAHSIDSVKRGDVLVTIKPEDVLLDSDLGASRSKHVGNNSSILEGTVVEIVRLRSMVEVLVDVGFPVKSMMTVNSLEGLALREGKRVRVILNKDSVGISLIT